MEEAKDAIDAGVRKWFGHAGFRPGQREAVQAVLEGRDALVVMPTGSGKSLCYQLAALLLPGTTLVVSPLIALMKDQVDGLRRRGISATCLNSSVSSAEMEARLARMVAGEYRLVYIAPERFRVVSFLESLARTELSLLTIDEAHCISQWGHDFRPDYLEIRKVLAQFEGLRVMAVTATATPDVRRDIRRQLGLGEGGRTAPFEEVLGFARPNLRLAVTDVAVRGGKLGRALEVIRAHRTGIVYVATRKHAVEVHEALRDSLGTSSGVEILMYHGALSDQERAEVQERFMRAEHPVVVATNAFGMGVDRADLRFVLHWDVPGGIEAYYQEVGRAGRDGGRSWCELLFCSQDVKIQEFFNEGANPTWEQAIAVLDGLKCRSHGGPLSLDVDEFGRQIGVRNGIAIETVLNVLQTQGVLTRASERRTGRVATVTLSASIDETKLAAVFAARREKARRDDARLRKMLDYCCLPTCRHAFILRYFGDQSPDARCGGCDRCEARGGRAAPAASCGERDRPAPVRSGADPVPPGSLPESVRTQLRRYVAIQAEARRLEEERLRLRDGLAAYMKQTGAQMHQVELDGEQVLIRCFPKSVYAYDEPLLRDRLGDLYEEILEPDTRRLKSCMAEALPLLRPILRKIGVPSRLRIREAIEAGRLAPHLFNGAFTRRDDVSFAVTHPGDENERLAHVST